MLLWWLMQRRRQYRDPTILPAIAARRRVFLTLAVSHQDFPPPKVEVLDPQLQAFQKPQPGAI
jgi:hypothetical protein